MLRIKSLQKYSAHPEGAYRRLQSLSLGDTAKKNQSVPDQSGQAEAGQSTKSR